MHAVTLKFLTHAASSSQHRSMSQRIDVLNTKISTLATLIALETDQDLIADLNKTLRLKKTKLVALINEDEDE